MTEIVALIALINACWLLGKTYKDNPIIKFLRTNRGMVLILASVSLLAYKLVIYDFQFGQILPSFYSVMILLVLLGFFYILKDRRAIK